MKSQMACPKCGKRDLRLKNRCDACGAVQPPLRDAVAEVHSSLCRRCEAGALTRVVTCGACDGELELGDFKRGYEQRFRRKAGLLLLASVLVAVGAGCYIWYENWSLAGKDLRDRDFSGWNLSGRNLSGSDLTDANLASADLKGANLSKAVLAGAKMSEADLSGADLSGADLTGSKLAGANLTGARLAGADLTDANLLNASLSGANLKGARLTEARLDRSDFTGAELSGTIFSNQTSLRGARGLTDAALASAFGISEDEVARVLIERKIRLDDERSISDDVDSVCVGGTADGVAEYPGNTSYHPIVAFNMSGSVNSYAPDNRFMHLGWEPMARRHAQLVVCSDSGWKVVQRCPGEWYLVENKRRIDLRRVRAWGHIRVIEASTGNVVADIHLEGPDPPACPYRSSTSDETGAMYGAAVPFDQIREAIQPYVAGV